MTLRIYIPCLIVVLYSVTVVAGDAGSLGDETRRPVANRLQDLEAELSDQAGQLGRLQGELTDAETQSQAASLRAEHVRDRVETLQNQIKETEDSMFNDTERVAFTAFKTRSDGPYFRDRLVTFYETITNVGDAYDGRNSRFRAPHAGVYLFRWHLYEYRYESFMSGKSTAAYLARNGRRQYRGFCTAAGPVFRMSPVSAASLASLSAQSVIMRLTAGEEINIKLSSERAVANGHLEIASSFSGHLIYTE